MHTYGSYSRVWLIISMVCLGVIGQGVVCHAMVGEILDPLLPKYPVINEFMAMNNSDAPVGPGELLDQDNESSDWIEIHNPTDQQVDLGGWHLTDDPDNLTQWSFPGNTLLRPGAFMVVFASGKDRTHTVTALHTNFKLSGQGEYLALVLPDGLTVAHAYTPAYAPQLTNISYGLTDYTDGQIPQFFTTPTPGAPNMGSTSGQIEPVQFSHERGFYDSPFELILSTHTEGAQIVVTLDGSRPTTLNGSRYTPPC